MGPLSKLSGADLKRLQDAFLSAFPTRSELAQMVRVGLDENLDTVAAQENLRAAAFELIRWAEAQGRLDELVAAARVENPGNPELRAYAQDRERWKQEQVDRSSQNLRDGHAKSTAWMEIDVEPSGA